MIQFLIASVMGTDVTPDRSCCSRLMRIVMQVIRDKVVEVMKTNYCRLIGVIVTRTIRQQMKHTVTFSKLSLIDIL